MTSPISVPIVGSESEEFVVQAPFEIWNLHLAAFLQTCIANRKKSDICRGTFTLRKHSATLTYESLHQYELIIEGGTNIVVIPQEVPEDVRHFIPRMHRH